MRNGRVIINRNICDNAPECSGIEVCPTGALFWDEEKDSINYNAETCIDCGLCADEEAGGCPIGAILWGRDEEDYIAKQMEVENETRTLRELEVERYGASPIEPSIEINEVQTYINNVTEQYIMLEFFNDDSINCLLHSIRIENIKKTIPATVNHKKVSVQDVSECFLCKISELPALVLIKDNQVLGVVEGYYDDSEEQKKSLFDQIQKIIK